MGASLILRRISTYQIKRATRHAYVRLQSWDDTTRSYHTSGRPAAVFLLGDFDARLKSEGHAHLPGGMPVSPATYVDLPRGVEVGRWMHVCALCYRCAWTGGLWYARGQPAACLRAWGIRAGTEGR